MCHLVTMDLYHKEIQGFFDFPVDNLRGSPFLIQHIKENVSYGASRATVIDMIMNIIIIVIIVYRYQIMRKVWLSQDILELLEGWFV